MPSAPELLDRSCKIRTVKILHQPDIKQLCCSDRNIRISGKIAVNLYRKEKGCKQHGKARIVLRRVKNQIHIYCKIISDHKLLKKAPCHQLQSIYCIFPVKGMFPLDLRQ